MIGIINYGVGNLQSVKNSLDYLNIPSRFVNKPQEIDKCNKIILPGVGAFGPAMEKLNKSGFYQKIKKIARQGKPILGICLGMQLFFEESEEHGLHKGLGLVGGRILSLKKKCGDMCIPHMGWNSIDICKDKKSIILHNIENGSCFYFLHSFYCRPIDKSIILAHTDYGVRFATIIQKDNIVGCQFHPEKSQDYGLVLLKNFQELI